MSPDTSSSSNPWFAISMGLVGLIVGYTIGNGSLSGAAPEPSAPKPTVAAAPSAPQQPEAANVKPVDPETDHIRGNPDASISVIEYSDFECPFCVRHHPTMEQIVSTYGDDVNWVYRHFPLSIHPSAQKAAEATECANELGGNDMFWKMADLLFEKGSDVSKLEGHAAELGLDASQFKSCLDSGKYAQHVKDDESSGIEAGINGTPGNIVLNNKTKEQRLVSGAQPFANFKSIIDGMLGN